MKYIISETGEFPPQYKVLQESEDGIWKPIFGPDPDLEDAQRKVAELQSVKKTVKKAKEPKKETPKKAPAKRGRPKKTATKK
jgi:hypothetical protein|tara:strand:- start:4494 stop:4739 length:246 start_codon:yes stop_codon:yes gene_type:complete